MTTELQDAVEASAKNYWDTVARLEITAQAPNIEFPEWDSMSEAQKYGIRNQALEFILPAIPYIRIALLRELGYEDRADEEELNLL